MKTFLEDLDVYAFRLGLPKWSAIFMIFIYPATWAIGAYRLGNWILTKYKIPFIKQIFFIFYFILKRISEMLTGIEIGSNAEIGKGIYIAHMGSIVIAHDSKVGDYPSFHQGVTVGGAGRGDNYGSPIIGDHVYFGAGAKVIGKIKVGNNVMIGANSVVVKDTPDNVVVGGVPAKVISYEGSRDFVHYRQKF